MQVAELFITLGIKGSDKTIQAFAQVEKGIKDTAGMAIEAKAALLGAGYALEQFFAKSGAQGTSLSNFNALIGEGTQILQKYQYAAKGVGVSNEEMESTFKSMSQIAAKQRLGIATPSMFGVVARETGGWTGPELQQAEQHPELMFQKVAEAMRRVGDVGTRMLIAKAYGLSDNIAAGINKGIFRPENMAAQKPNIYSEKEVESLNKANIAWIRLNDVIEKAVGHFNAAHGQQLERGFEVIVNGVMKLVTAVELLAERTHFFDYLGQSISWLAKEIDSVSLGSISKEVDSVAGKINAFAGYVKSLNLKSGFGTEMVAMLAPAEEALKNTINLVKTLFSLLSDDKHTVTVFDAISNTLKAFTLGLNTVIDMINNLALVANYELETPEQQKKDVKGREASESQGAFMKFLGLDFISMFKKETAEKPVNLGVGFGGGLKPEQSAKLQEMISGWTSWIKSIGSPNVPSGAAAAVPPQTPLPAQTKQTTQNVNVNNNIHMTPAEGVTANQVADAIDRNHRNAFRQLDSQVQWS